MILKLPHELQVPHCRACESARVRFITGCAAASFYRCLACGAATARHHARSEMGTAPDHFQHIDFEKYARSVKTTRERSYAELLRRVQCYVPHGDWLDVGCSYGWLLAYLTDHGFQAEGVEPSVLAAVLKFQT